MHMLRLSTVPGLLLATCAPRTNQIGNQCSAGSEEAQANQFCVFSMG
jgi:hypothetical protein